jgi:hypothetical protein
MNTRWFSALVVALIALGVAVGADEVTSPMDAPITSEGGPNDPTVNAMNSPMDVQPMDDGTMPGPAVMGNGPAQLGSGSPTQGPMGNNVPKFCTTWKHKGSGKLVQNKPPPNFMNSLSTPGDTGNANEDATGNETMDKEKGSAEEKKDPENADDPEKVAFKGNKRAEGTSSANNNPSPTATPNGPLSAAAQEGHPNSAAKVTSTIGLLVLTLASLLI